MAKAVGSENPESEVTRRKDSGGSNAIDGDTFRQAVAEILEQAGIVAKAKGRLKEIRTSWNHKGIALGALDKAVKMSDWTRSEIRDEFSTERQYAGWLGLPVDYQRESFQGKTDDQVQKAEWFQAGRTAALTLKPAKPPEEVPPEYHQAWLAGFQEQDEAAWMDAPGAEEVQVEAPAAKAKPKVGSKAKAKEEAKPQPSGQSIANQKDFILAQPSWKGYSDDPDDWFGAQWRDFAKWAHTVPEGFIPEIKHPGVKLTFERWDRGEIDDSGNVIPPGKGMPPSDEASDEDLASDGAGDDERPDVVH